MVFKHIPQTNSQQSRILSSTSHNSWLIKLLLYTLAAELLEPLGCQAVQAVASAWGFEHELRRLEATTNSIKNVLLDAEHRQVEDPPAEDWLFEETSDGFITYMLGFLVGKGWLSSGSLKR
ncbi:hypothetical protein Droror1_Dr00008861 [Drosera rotundifolia]